MILRTLASWKVFYFEVCFGFFFLLLLLTGDSRFTSSQIVILLIVLQKRLIVQWFKVEPDFNFFFRLLDYLLITVSKKSVRKIPVKPRLTCLC